MNIKYISCIENIKWSFEKNMLPCKYKGIFKYKY